MSTMANTTFIVTTVTKTANKEKTSKEADAALKVNILDFCEEHYEDILPVIMDKICRDKRKEVHARLDFGENPRKSRKSAFDRLSNTYSPTKSGLNEGNSRDRSHSRGCSRRRSSSGRDCPRNRNRPCGIEESYSNTCSSYRAGDRHGYYARNRNRSRSMKRGRESKSSLSRVSERSLENLPGCGTCRTLGNAYMVPHVQLYLNRGSEVWFDELPPKSIDGYKDLKATFLAYFMQQNKYVKDPVEIYNIKQRDGETIEEFMKCFKIETGCMKGAPECMRISGFMHGVNNPELTKRLIRGETVVASKKKVYSLEVTGPVQTANL
nr:reverse transcriptase domain-containing protein [Tanacetum cinerariifolium]